MHLFLFLISQNLFRIQALEKLRTTSKRIEKDLEVLYGNLSMEFFEKLTGQEPI
jgi:hypothetical protein